MTNVPEVAIRANAAKKRGVEASLVADLVHFHVTYIHTGTNWKIDEEPVSYQSSLFPQPERTQHHGQELPLLYHLDLATLIYCLARSRILRRHLDFPPGNLVASRIAYRVPCKSGIGWGHDIILLTKFVLFFLSLSLCSTTLQQPFEAVFQFVKQITAFLEKLITWPRDLGKAIMSCQETFPSPM
jgi:hypothetical protein